MVLAGEGRRIRVRNYEDRPGAVAAEGVVESERGEPLGPSFIVRIQAPGGISGDTLGTPAF